MVRGYTVHIHYIHAALKALPSAPQFAHTVCTVKMTAKTITGSVHKSVQYTSKYLLGLFSNLIPLH